MFQAFEIGPFIVWSRVIFMAVGLWIATEFFLRIAQSANLSLQHFRERSWWYVGAFLFVGRIAAILDEYKVYVRDPLRMVIVWDGGFSLLGGAIGIAAVLAYATRGHRSTFLQWLDALVPSTTFALVFSWLGNFFSGRAYGRPTDVLWGVTYDAMDVRYTVPIHPVQLYYAFFFFVLTFALLVVRKKAKRVGTETLVGIIVGAAGTFLIEYFRGDIPILFFATQIDMLLLLGLFVSLGAFAAFGNRLSKRFLFIYEASLAVVAAGYLLVRPLLDLETYEVRFSQLLAIFAILAVVVYVVDHRRRYPYL